jgi:hypothetical protein
MDDEIAVIHQNPFGDIIAFNTERKLTHFLQLLGNCIRYGMRLARVGNGADDKKVCERSNFAKIKDPKVVSFLRFSGANGGEPVWQLLARN